MELAGALLKNTPQKYSAKILVRPRTQQARKYHPLAFNQSRIYEQNRGKLCHKNRSNSCMLKELATQAPQKCARKYIKYKKYCDPEKRALHSALA